MKFNRIFFLILVVTLAAFSVVAQDTPSDVKDLVGARAAGGETQLKNRGYKFVKTEKGGDRSWSNWWKASSSVCLTVVTMNGRYDSIVSGPASDCGQSANSGGNAGGAPSDVADLVGARAAGGETQLRNRGYKFIKTENGGDRTWSNWWKASSSVCLTVVTMNGRYDSIVSGPSSDCNQSSNSGGNTGSSMAAPADVANLVGARASSGETQLKNRGYRFVKTEKGDDRTWSNWWNYRKKVCLTVVTMEGKFDSIVSGPGADCNR